MTTRVLAASSPGRKDDTRDAADLERPVALEGEALACAQDELLKSLAQSEAEYLQRNPRSSKGRRAPLQLNPDWFEPVVIDGTRTWAELAEDSFKLRPGVVRVSCSHTVPFPFEWHSDFCDGWVRF